MTPSRIGMMLPTYRVSSATSRLRSRMKAVTPSWPSLSVALATCPLQIVSQSHRPPTRMRSRPVRKTAAIRSERSSPEAEEMSLGRRRPAPRSPDIRPRHGGATPQTPLSEKPVHDVQTDEPLIRVPECCRHSGEDRESERLPQANRVDVRLDDSVE